MPVTTRSSGNHSGNTDTMQKSKLQTVIEMPVKFSPAIAALPLNDSKEMQKEEEACEPAFNQNSPCVSLEEKGKDSISSHAPTISLKTMEKLRGDHAEGKQSKAKEDPNLGQLKSKPAQTLGHSVMMLLRNKNHIPNQKEQTFCASKRPSSELSGTTDYPQSPIHSEDDQGDSCRGTHVRTKREKGQRLLHNVVGFPTTLTPVDGIRQGLEVQSPITTALRAQNQLTSRTLMTSRFFANDLPTSTERAERSRLNRPSAERVEDPAPSCEEVQNQNLQNGG
ncbi:unnamed protein product [Calypogeia fissa]